MNDRRPLDAVIEQEFLPLRAKILELAAGLDRLDRAAGEAGADARRRQLGDALSLLLDGDGRRAERVQLHFSRQYDANWRREFKV